MLVHLLITIVISSVVAQSGHPEFDPSMEKIILQEESLKEVQCVAKGELPLSYRWYNQNDTEITFDRRQDVFARWSENGLSLIFAVVKPFHEGLYTCIAKNKHGTASKPYDIIVNITSVYPDFVPAMERIILQEGSLKKVQCVAKGELPLTYTWYNQSGAEISSDADQDVFTRRAENGLSLIFAEVNRSHAGRFSCNATNKHGTASKPYVIVVNTTSELPKFELSKEKIILQEGSLEKVECVAKGELPITYRWLSKNQEDITSDANQDMFTHRSENGISLIFPEVNLSHAGISVCIARNNHGIASKVYDIIVKITSGNITTNETAEIVTKRVVNITENSVEFIVETKGDPDSFYIRYKERLDDRESSVQIKKGEKAVVKDLVPAGRYEFRFQIEPPSQIKRSSSPYDVILLPAVPDVIFRSIKDGLVDVEWFRSIDDLTRDTIEEYELSYNTIRQIGGRSWEASDCVITTKIPLRNCGPSKHTIAGLQRGLYYEIRLRMRTSAGYGKPYVNKIYIL